MQRAFRTALAVVVGLTLLSTPARAARAEPTAAEWRQDLDYLVETLVAVHPDLFARVDEEIFRAHVVAIEEAIPVLTSSQIVLRLMQLVALVQDGHTSLEPGSDSEFGNWYPIRFYRFTDGIFITAIDQRHGDLVGARVERIGNLSAQQAWDRAGTLLGADNEFGALENAAFPLSNATALAGLEVTDTPDLLALTLVTRTGERRELELGAIAAPYDPSFQYWGEIWGPASDAVTYVTPFGLANDHYDVASGLPLHVRFRSAYWSTYLEADRLLYVQLNYMGDGARNDRTFGEFFDEVWRTVDAGVVDRLVLDIRYNIGGDGSLVRDVVHEIIKRDAINRKGALFTIVGRATFSAGIMLARALEEHTATTFVGEPPGAYWESYGDSTSFELPHSGLVAWVSTVYHQLSSYVGNQRVLHLELPAQFTSADYLAGNDPALAEIRASGNRPLLANVFRQHGSEAALAEYERRSAAYGDVDWWAPFSLEALNSLGYELLEAERIEDALAALQLNVRRHPDHWRPWYSLAEGYRHRGDVELAIENYERALAVDPFNNLAPYQRQALEELRSEARGSAR